MTKKWMGILLVLTLVVGGGLLVPRLMEAGGEEVIQEEAPQLSTLIGTGIWWGKQESLERHTAQPDVQIWNEKI
jgi:hypothetical protein